MPKIPSALSHLSEEFRATITPTDFAELMGRSALSRLKQVSWSSRSVSPGRGELEGVATTDSGGSIPLKVTLVKENGAWRIYALGKDAAGMTGGQGAALPGPKEGFALLKGTMAKVATAVATRDMSPLVGPPTTESARAASKRMQEGLQPFIDNHIDLTALANIEPEIEEPVVDERGYMVMTGHYQVDEKTRVKFKVSYKQTLLAWQFAALELNYLKARPH